MINHLLSFIIFTPLIGALLILGMPKSDKSILRYVGLITSFVTFILTCLLVAKFDPKVSQIQFAESHAWIESLKISYLIGVDGLSIWFIPLTALLFLLGILASWELSVGTKGYLILFLILETTLLGTLCSQDLFLFFAFWQASVLPIYFMLGIWGHQDRVVAATKFFLFQLGGSAFLLLGMLAIYYTSQPHTFSLVDLTSAAATFNDKQIEIMGLSFPFGKTIFMMLLIGFAVRIPIFPFHSWFPHAQSEAPTVVAVILAALFIKTGAYALIRVNYALFPAAAEWIAVPLAVVGVVNIIYGALCALGQKDIRRLMAYMCVSHMGFVLLGLGVFSTTSFHGALLQMFAHGIYAGLLFFLVGILGSRSGHFNIVGTGNDRSFGGLVSRVPVLTGFFTIGVFAALGAPGFGAFPAESLVFLGTFPVHPLLTVLGLGGVLLTAGYLLWMYRRVFLGAEPATVAVIADLTLREKAYLIPLVVLTVVTGVYPSPVISYSAATLSQVLTILVGAAK